MSLRKNIVDIFKSKKTDYIRYIKLKIDKKEEAEDILQDVFFNVLDDLQKNPTKEIVNIEAWIFTAIKNKIIDFYRKKRPSTFSAIEDLFKQEIEQVNLKSAWCQNEFNPENILINNETSEEINKGISILTEEQKEIFMKNKIDGISFKQISKETGININTLLAREFQGKKKLKKILEPIYQEYMRN